MPPRANIPRRPLAFLLYPLLAVILVWLLFPSPAAAEAIDRDVEQALVAGDWETVYSLLDSCPNSSRDPIETFLLRQARLATGRTCALDLFSPVPESPGLDTRVLKWVESFLNAHPENPAANLLSAFALESENDYDTALAACTRYLVLDTCFAPTWLARGDLYLRLHRWPDAIADLTRAISLRPDCAAAYVSRGLACSMAGDPESALRDDSIALELTRDPALVALKRGSAFEKINMTPEAVAAYTLAIELQPDLTAAYSLRGDLYGRQGNFRNALTDFEKAVETVSDETRPTKPDLQARVWIIKGLVWNYPDTTTPPALAAGLYLTVFGRTDEAIDALTRVLDDDSLQAVAWQCRANLLALSGELPLAISDYSRYLDLQPYDTAAYFDRGFCYLLSRHYAKAVTDFESALALEPSYAYACAGRAMAYEGAGDYPHAIADYQRFRELSRFWRRPDRQTSVYRQYLTVAQDARKSLSSGRPCLPDPAIAAAVESTYAALTNHDWPALAALMRKDDLKDFRKRVTSSIQGLRTEDDKLVWIDGYRNNLAPHRDTPDNHVFTDYMHYLTAALPAYTRCVNVELIEIVDLFCRSDDRYLALLRLRWSNGAETVAIESVVRNDGRWRLEKPRMIELLKEALKAIPSDFRQP